MKPLNKIDWANYQMDCVRLKVKIQNQSELRYIRRGASQPFGYRV